MSESGGDEVPVISVIDASTAVPAGLPAAAALFAEAKASDQAVSIVVAPGESRKIMAKRRHDLKAAVRTLTFTVQALKDGYTFQDAAAPAKVEAIAKAVEVLRGEAELLGRILPG